MSEESKLKKKYKQGPKSGKVLRISDFAWSVIRQRRKDEGQSTKDIVDLMINEIHDLSVQLESLVKAKDSGRLYFILPESKIVCSAKTEPEARGEAVLLAVKRGKRKPDEPIAVREI